jgi:hypothetical protein
VPSSVTPHARQHPHEHCSLRTRSRNSTRTSRRRSRSSGDAPSSHSIAHINPGPPNGVVRGVSLTVRTCADPSQGVFTDRSPAVHLGARSGRATVDRIMRREWCAAQQTWRVRSQTPGGN